MLFRSWSMASLTGNNYSIIISDLKLNGYVHGVGDEIGMMNESGLCVGGAKLSNDMPIAISAWQDDPLTEVRDGYIPGETIRFSYWCDRLQQEILLDAVYLRGNGTYGNGDYATISLSGSIVPGGFGLSQNFPNPFNPETVIRYQLPRSGEVDLSIYNSVGQRVRKLVLAIQPAGFYTIQWNGTDDLGNKLPSGIYVYQIRADEFCTARKMIIMK